MNKMEIYEENMISQEILNKLLKGWKLLEELCLICNYTLIASPDNEKSCIACKIIESKNYIKTIDHQFHEFLQIFKRLTTPSKNEAAEHFKSFINGFHSNTIEDNDLKPKFSLDFSQYISKFLKRGYKITNIKCENCNYCSFKEESNSETICLKCLYTDAQKNEELFKKNFMKFSDSLNNLSNFMVDTKEITLRYINEFQGGENDFLVSGNHCLLVKKNTCC